MTDAEKLVYAAAFSLAIASGTVDDAIRAAAKAVWALRHARMAGSPPDAEMQFYAEFVGGKVQ